MVEQEQQQHNQLLKGLAYLCFIPYSNTNTLDDNNNNNNDNNDIDNNDNNDNNNKHNNDTYHWFQGIFITLPNKNSYGLMGDTADSPPIPHPCCYPDTKTPPKFYNVTMIDYATHRKTFIHYILQTGGDNISLSTHWELDDFVLNETLRKMKLSGDMNHFEFHTLNVKYGEEAVTFMKNYFPKLKPDPSCIICIGNLEIELKKNEK